MVLVGSSYMTYTMLYHSFLTIASLSTFPYLAKIVVNVCRSISGGTFVTFTVRSASADLSDSIFCQCVIYQIGKSQCACTDQSCEWISIGSANSRRLLHW